MGPPLELNSPPALSSTAIIVGFERILYVADEEMMPGAVSVCVIVISPGVLPRDVDVTFNTEDGSALGKAIESLFRVE